jgi:hypothetical protein
MGKSNNNHEDFDLGFSPEEFEQLQVNQGLGIRRIHYGHYTFEIVSAAPQTSKGKTPHVMMKVTARVVAAADGANKSEIGSEISNFYAGSPQSPEFMKQRLKALCVATGVSAGKSGGLKGSHFIGKRFDASVVWELSKSDKLDDMGRSKYYVNDRMKAERKVGSEIPMGFNPNAESAKAEQYLAGSAPDAAGGVGDIAPWDQGSANGVVELAPIGGEASAPTGFIDESEVDPVAMAYRAVYKLGGDESADAKTVLLDAGIDPEGPVNVELITDPDLRKAYEAKFAPKIETKPGLPPLNGKARTGVRAPAQR